MRQKVLALAGPTASGKTGLAIQAALERNGEIVCMDSMQVYRGMDIGTAKPTLAERALVPHHLLDVADPRQPFSVAEYRELAEEAIRGILNRGRLPVLCGGTGLYLRALSRGLDFGGTPADPGIRARYQRLADTRGARAVHDLLMARDRKSAERLHPNNLRRVIRALEVLEITGRPFSGQEMPKEGEGPFDIRPFALRWPREALYARVNARVDAMLAAGLLEEVRALVEQGVPPEAQSMQGLGYKELLPCLEDRKGLPEAVETIKRRTRNYAKRQMTWFLADSSVRWLDAGNGMASHLGTIAEEMGFS